MKPTEEMINDKYAEMVEAIEELGFPVTFDDAALWETAREAVHNELTAKSENKREIK